MAYPNLEESNRALREQQARNPVIPNVPPADQAPINAAGIGPEFGGEPTIASAVAKPTFGIGGSIDYGAEFNPPSAAPAPAASVATGSPPAVAQPAAPAPTPAPQAQGAGPVITPEALRPRTPDFQTDASQPSIADVNRDARAQLDILNARSEQNIREGNANDRARTAEYGGRLDAQAADQAARVARFRATNGADMILAPENSGYDGQRVAIVKGAEAAEKAAAETRAQSVAAGIPRPDTRNLQAEAIAGNDAVARSAAATSDQQKSQIGTAVQREKLAQEKRMNELGSILQNEKDPAKLEQAKSAMLTLLGKDKPDQWKLHVVQRPDTLAADGFTVIRGGQDLVTMGPDGKTQVVPMPGGAGAAGAAPAKQYPVGTERKDKNGMKQKFDGQKWVNQ